MSEEAPIIGGSKYVTSDVIAQLFGLTVRRVQQLAQDGVIHTTETGQGRRYDLVPTIQTYVKYLSDKAHGKASTDRESALKQEKLEAEIEVKKIQGELHRMRADIEAGRYISVEEVTLDYSRFFVTFKNFCLGLPSRLSDMIAAYVDPVEARRIEKNLQQEVRRLLNGFAVAGVVTDGKT